MYNYPVLYAVEVGHWRLHDSDAQQLREFLLRGGFLMVDDFHGSNAGDHGVADREGINESGRSSRKVWSIKVLPRQGYQTANSEQRPDFSYDLRSERAFFKFPAHSFSIPGSLMKRAPPEKIRTGAPFRDDKGRIMVAICHNMDLGDAWEHSDEAKYLEKVGVARLPDRDELLRLRSNSLSCASSFAPYCFSAPSCHLRFKTRVPRRSL